MKNNKLQNMRCTCPYAYDGEYCKHMAAVLYAIEDNKIVNPSIDNHQKDTQTKEKELEKVIASIPEDKLRELVFQLASEDISLANRIYTQYSNICGEQQILYLKKEVDRIFNQYSDRYGYIDYREMFDFVEELHTFLEEKVYPLVDKYLLMQAFELTNYVFCCIGNQDMDDSNGGSSEIAEHCYELWLSVFDKANEDERKQMFQWFVEHKKGYVFDYMEEYIEDILMEEFQNEDMLREKLAVLDREIQMIEKNKNSGISEYQKYEFVKNIQKRMELMEQLDFSAQEIQEYRAKYRQFSDIRKLEIQEYIQKGKYDKAIEVLKESKKLDVNYAGLIAHYSSQLIELYQKIGDNKNYKEELLYQVFSVYQRDLTYIQKLKQISTDEEWIKLQKRILISGSTNSIKYDFLQSEGMYEELLAEVIKSNSIYLVNHYEKVLKKKFPMQVCEIYIAYVKHQAEQVSSRNHYQELVAYLKKIKSYPQGNKKAQEIADEWKREYRKRPAMMDEIQKGGF
ncbi:MAG: SWIM zinc finger family protein [Lachnospiraceae bacterium]|nr:SWIM zinc finger family protein [Lachnospiraceae bacterium]